VIHPLPQPVRIDKYAGYDILIHMMNHFKNGAAQLGSKIDEYLSAALRGGFFKNRIFDPDNIKIFNRYVMASIVIAALYFILDLFLINSYKDAASAISKVSASGAGPASPAEYVMPVEANTYSHYSDKISSRNIFTAGPEIQAESQPGLFEPAAESVGLVGIIAGNNPQAIIEDKKSQKTYYLIKGQTVNDITVEDISEGGVTLEYRGKKITLLL
jgi:hypothetical protein